mgnify:CR=1 FL=1
MKYQLCILSFWKMFLSANEELLKNNLETEEYTTIVDAIFGVGLSRPVEGKYAELISTMNRASAYKVAVDIPSGIDSDTGFEKGIAFRQILRLPLLFAKEGCVFIPDACMAVRSLLRISESIPYPERKSVCIIWNVKI